jgi:hypothetical protein
VKKSETVKKSYQLVERAFKAGKDGRFLEPFDQVRIHWLGPIPRIKNLKVRL